MLVLWSVGSFAAAPLTVPLAAGAPTAPSSGGQTAADLAGMGDVLLPHPGGATSFVTLPYGDRRLAVGFAPVGDGWEVSADLDADGRLSAAERITVAEGAWAELVGHLPVAGGRLAVPMSFRTRREGDVRWYDWRQFDVREGRLPDGTAIRVEGVGGRFDAPGAGIAADLDGDGVGDTGLMSWFTVAQGIVTTKGGSWRFSLPPDGAALVLVPTDEPAPGLRAGRPAPDFSLRASDGRVHTLAEYAGRPLFLDFWATWCAPCVALHPEVQALIGRHPELAVFGVAANDTQPEVDRWLRQHPTPWPSAAIGPGGAVNAAYGVSQWPTHALVDADGRLVVIGTFDEVRRALGEIP